MPSARLPFLGLPGLLLFESFHNFVEYVVLEHLHFLVRADNGELDVAVARLDDLEQTLDGQLYGRLLAHVGLPQLLQQLAHGFRRAANGIGLPPAEDAGRLRVEELRRAALRIKAGNQSRDAKRPHTAGLRVLLLRTGDEFCEELDTGGVGVRQPVGLRADARHVHKHAGISVQAGKAQREVVVNAAQLARCRARVVQLEGAAALAAKHDDVGALHANSTGAPLHGLERVLDLEDVAVGREYTKRSVVATHRVWRMVDVVVCVWVGRR